MSEPELVIVGRVRKAHGVRGELVIESITDAPDTIFVSGRRVFVDRPRGEPVPVHIERASPFKDGFIVAVRDLSDRNAAEQWRERYVYLPADELEPPGDDEIYQHDLIGMSVRHRDETIGTVESVLELPQGLMLEVRTNEALALVPYLPEIVTAVDGEARTIDIDPPEGLLPDRPAR